jgi:hypothetical protein
VSVDEEAAIKEMAFYGKLVTASYDKPVFINLQSRIDQAKAAYSTRSQRLSRLRFLAPSHDGKHLRQHLERQAILAHSGTGPSIFFKDYTPEQIKEAFWEWFLQFFDTGHSLEEYCERNENVIDDDETEIVWKKFERENQFRIAIKCKRAVGAVLGEESRFICLDIGLAASVVHTYPISEGEALGLMPQDTFFAIDAF